MITVFTTIGIGIFVLNGIVKWIIDMFVIAGMAQWQSSALVMRRLLVRLRLPAPDASIAQLARASD